MDNVNKSKRFNEIAEHFFKSTETALTQWQSKREQSEQAVDTRGRIFEAARKVFARKGRSATVREICTAAQANVSAVNYYFGNKDKLLAVVLEEFMYEVRELYPRDGCVDKDADAEDKLFGFILSGMAGLLLSHGHDYFALNKLLLEGFVEGFEEFEPVADRDWVEMHDMAIPIVDELTGKSLPTDTLERLSTGFFSQMFFYAMHVEDLVLAKNANNFLIKEVTAISKHIAAFTIGGIKSYWEFMDAEDVFPNLCHTDHCKRSRKFDRV